MSVKILAIAGTTGNLFPFIKSFISFDSVSFTCTNCLNFSWIKELTIQNYANTTHTDVSNPFSGWVFVSLKNLHILINRTVFLCKRKNVFDTQSFTVGNLHYSDIISCNILQNGRIYLQVYLRWLCPEWNHSWSAQHEEDICLLRWSVPCKPLSWLFIWAPYAWCRECLPSPIPFNLKMIIWIFFSLCIVSIHNFWYLMSDCWIGEFENRWIGEQVFIIFDDRICIFLIKTNYLFWILKIRYLE